MSRPVLALTVALLLTSVTPAPAQIFGGQPPLPGPVVDTRNLATPNPVMNMQQPGWGSRIGGFFSKLNPFKSSPKLAQPQQPQASLPQTDSLFKRQP